MRDFKYYSLLIGEPKWRPSLNAVASDCLRPLTKAFGMNLKRTASLAFTPVELAYAARRDQRFADYAASKATGKIEPQLSFLDEDELPEPIRLELEHERDKERLVSQHDFDERRKDYGLSYVESFLNAHPGMQVSMEAIMSSVVTESWMAFEILVTDLFYEALDHGPSEWRINVGRKYAEFRRGSNWEPQKVAPTVTSDPQEKYGSFLKNSDAIPFQRFRLIKFWYKIAFGEEVEKLFREVEGGHIRALSAVRNVILHKGGIADATYKKEVSKFPELNRAEENKPISINGEIVKKLRNAAIVLGVELILYIDRALTPSVTKP
jgi:hypothetical protein